MVRDLRFYLIELSLSQVSAFPPQLGHLTRFPANSGLTRKDLPQVQETDIVILILNLYDHES